MIKLEELERAFEEACKAYDLVENAHRKKRYAYHALIAERFREEKEIFEADMNEKLNRETDKIRLLKEKLKPYMERYDIQNMKIFYIQSECRHVCIFYIKTEKDSIETTLIIPDVVFMEKGLLNQHIKNFFGEWKGLKR